MELLTAYKQQATINRLKLDRLAPDWLKYYNIRVKVISEMRGVIKLQRGKQTFDYYLGSGTYFNNCNSRRGTIEIKKIPILFDI